MNLSMAREFRLSAKRGHGIRCDNEGLFVGEIPLLERANDKWILREDGELARELGKAYGLPIDILSKKQRLGAVAHALNQRDVARAQIGTLLLQFPDPLPPAENTPTREKIIKLAAALDRSEMLKIDDLHYPAKTPGGKGGEFAPKNSEDQSAAADKESGFDPTSLSMDDPRRGEAIDFSGEGAGRTASETGEALAAAEERQAVSSATRAAVRAAMFSESKDVIRTAARRAFREAAIEAAKKIGSKLVLSEIPIVGVAADISTVYDIYRFATEFKELRQAIKAATRFVNKGPHTLEDLRVSPESKSFENYRAFVKLGIATFTDDDLEKRFGPAPQGMEYHHIVERASGLGSYLETTDNIVCIPTIFHEAVTARFARRSAEFGGKSLREWLEGKSPEVQRYWGIKVMKEVGLIVGE